MENTNDYNFFYINEKEEMPIKVIITTSLGECKYNLEQIQQLVSTIQNENTQGKISLYQDDGENFWNLSNHTQLDIGNKEDNFKKWDKIKQKALVIEIEDLLVFAKSQDKTVAKKYKL